MLGLRTYSPAVVTTHQWYVGPGQQGEAMDGGYDEEYEDRLFEEIDWPGDGYRLFQIGSFIGERDWFDNHWESNCFFVPRALLEQAGGYDESFSVPGGGYTNLDLFERLTTTPAVNVVDIIGEASFHQLHGGTTTNQPDVEERHARLSSYRRGYQEIRGRPFRNSGKARHVVGSILNEAAHTRPRWRTGLVFREAQRVDPGEFPDKGVPVSDELGAEFTEAFWRSLAWRETPWLGRRAGRPAADLIAYQELVARVRPDWILDTHTGSGGRAMFLASICELIGTGRVLSIRRRAEGDFPEHPRISYLTGNPVTAPVQEKVRETIGEGRSTMLVIALARRGGVLRLFGAFSPLVPVGGYAVVEDTVLNGHPVMPEFGPGPTEAVREILQAGDFVADSRMERFGPTFNPGGFLKRVS
jgi:cephalosporin hydroxylase